MKEKRYLCGPRIASELRGPAKRVLLGKQADWLSFDGGVRKLIETLRQGRGQPMVPEMSELLMKYFKGTKRVKGESMGDYVTRKARPTPELSNPWLDTCRNNVVSSRLRVGP